MHVAAVFVRFIAFTALCTSFLLVWQYHTLLRPTNDSNELQLSAVFNATLGFEAVTLISLPTRRDRRDAVTLIASLSGVFISKVFDAVKGQDVGAKERPKSDMDHGNLGAWRSHMDVFRWIVDNRIQTALILEDDVDWDLTVKAQLQDFAINLQSLNKTETAPYGLKWDVLHLGPSFVNLGDRSTDVVKFYPDINRWSEAGGECSSGAEGWYCWDYVVDKALPSVPAEDRRQQRLIIPTYQSVGLVAMAVTFEGARRLLYHLSWVGVDDTLDWDIARLMEHDKLVGYTVVPPIMSSWKVAGPGDSDLINDGAGPWDLGHTNAEGSSPGLGNSARKSLTATFGSRP